MSLLEEITRFFYRKIATLNGLVVVDSDLSPRLTPNSSLRWSSKIDHLKRDSGWWATAEGQS